MPQLEPWKKWDNATPGWENSGIEPPPEKKTEGYRAGNKPPAGWFNWFWTRVSKNVSEIQDRVKTLWLSTKSCVEDLSNSTNVVAEDASSTGSARKVTLPWVSDINDLVGKVLTVKSLVKNSAGTVSFKVNGLTAQNLLMGLPLQNSQSTTAIPENALGLGSIYSVHFVNATQWYVSPGWPGAANGTNFGATRVTTDLTVDSATAGYALDARAGKVLDQKIRSLQNPVWTTVFYDSQSGLPATFKAIGRITLSYNLDIGLMIISVDHPLTFEGYATTASTFELPLPTDVDLDTSEFGLLSNSTCTRDIIANWSGREYLSVLGEINFSIENGNRNMRVYHRAITEERGPLYNKTNTFVYRIKRRS